MAASEGHHADTFPEPKTPMWLPAVGAVLFLVAGLVWGLGDPSPDASKAQPTGAAAADAGAAPAKPAAPGH